MAKLVENKRLLRRLVSNTELMLYCLEGTDTVEGAISLYDLVKYTRITTSETIEEISVKVNNHEYTD